MTAENVKDYVDFESRPHVMVVDDDRRIRDLLSRFLTDQGFVVLPAGNAEEAQKLLKSFEVDVMVVDVMMPGQNGVDFTRSFREKENTPIILLTALGETEDRIKGLEAGADDYLAKPFEPKELVLRLNAILKRTSTPEKKDAPFRMGGWVFDPETGVLSSEGEEVNLTDAEVTLLKMLGRYAGEVLSREKLARLCGVDAGERTIDVQVTRLRRKIEEDSKNPRYLQTVRGKGYLLRVEKV